MRILADLPDTDIQWLDQRAAELGKSRAALLREAVTAFRAGERDWLERYGRGIDGAVYEDAVRGQWSRESLVALNQIVDLDEAVDPEWGDGA